MPGARQGGNGTEVSLEAREAGCGSARDLELVPPTTLITAQVTVYVPGFTPPVADSSFYS
jgi:hypothetical protein